MRVSNLWYNRGSLDWIRTYNISKINIHYILYNTLSLKPSIFTPLISSKTVVIQSTAHNILPSFARVLAIKNTYAVLLPWQTNSIFIIFQVPPKMLYFALICPDLPSISREVILPQTLSPKSETEQNTAN